MAETTNTVGFFNGHKFPIHLSISALNLTLRLEPGEYIVDRQQRKINDPYLENYAGKGQLSKEVSKKPVPVLSIPRFNATRPATGESSVREVTEFTEDAGKVRRPLLPAPRTEPAPAENVSSFRAMSMDEARRNGFVHKTREVPENFGAEESMTGPKGPIPEIKYATDMGPSGRKTALPKTVVQPTLKATVPLKAATKPKALPAPAAPPPAPVATKPAAKPATTKSSAARPPAPLRRAAVTPAPPLDESSPFGNKVVSDLPPPNLEEAEPNLESEEESNDAEQAVAQMGDEQAEEQPEGDQEETAESEQPEGTPEPQSFVCLKDGKVFGKREQLVTHIQANYPRQMKALMEAYPEG